jgi:hypothetical protein
VAREIANRATLPQFHSILRDSIWKGCSVNH